MFSTRILLVSNSLSIEKMLKQRWRFPPLKLGLDLLHVQHVEKVPKLGHLEFAIEKNIVLKKWERNRFRANNVSPKFKQINNQAQKENN